MVSIEKKFCICLGLLLFIFITACVDRDNDLSQAPEEDLIKLSGTSLFNWQDAYLTISTNQPVNLISADYAPLKYDKHMVLSYTIDDVPITAYSRAFAIINKHFVDYIQNFHVGFKHTTGIMPEKTLGYTDGCGTEIRFPIGLAIWATNSNSVISDIMGYRIPGTTYPYLVWKDVIPIIDFGGDIYFHDVNLRYVKDGNLDSIRAGFDYAQARTTERIGRKIKTLVVPGGDKKYYQAASVYNPITIISDQGGTDVISPKTQTTDLYKKYMPRQYFDKDEKIADYFDQIKTNYESDNPYWFQFFNHGASLTFMELLRRINDTYGKDGSDNIWFATIDEVYEYYHFKANYPIQKTIEGNKATFRIEAAPDYKLPEECTYHRDFTLLVTGLESMSGVTLTFGPNVYGYSYKYRPEDKTLMINLNCNPSLLERAQRYTDIYKDSPSDESKADALYFINQLSPERRTSFLNSIN
ncbi:hypothetical protein [Bacteroides graminisolvens]